MLTYCVVLTIARFRAGETLPASPEVTRVTRLIILFYHIIVVFRKNAEVLMFPTRSDQLSYSQKSVLLIQLEF